MNAPNSSGVLATGSASRDEKRVFASGEFNAETKAWLSLATMSLWVPAGATSPHQVSVSKPLRGFSHGEHGGHEGAAPGGGHREP